jgi:hypothetical protein
MSHRAGAQGILPDDRLGSEPGALAVPAAKADQNVQPNRKSAWDDPGCGTFLLYPQPSRSI